MSEQMTWTKDYSGHFTATGSHHTYTLTSRSRGWDLVILDSCTDIVIARHHEGHKSTATAIAARYERSSITERQALRSEFRAWAPN